MKYKLVIFDFDGTLADSFPWAANIANDMADKYRFKRIQPGEDELLRTFSARQLLKHLGVSWWKSLLVAKDLRRAMSRDIHLIPLFDGAEQVLHTLAQSGVILAVVSSNSYQNIHQVLGGHNAALIRYFECGVSMFGKAAKIKKVLRKCKVQPNEAILIGDEIRDGDAARQAKIAFGAVTWGFTKVAALEAQSPHALFTRMEDIATEVTRV